MPVVILSGPPCSGKSTLARLEAERHGGAVLDWDDIRQEITGLPTHDHGDLDVERLMPAIENEFRYRADTLVAQAHATRSYLWMIRAAPNKQHRAIMRRMYQAEGVMLAIPPGECLARLEASGRPPSALEFYRPQILKWWQTYQPGTHELTITSWSPDVDPLHSGRVVI